MFVQHPKDAPEGELVLNSFAEVQQEWHPWRRRYDLFLRYVFSYLPLGSPSNVVDRAVVSY